ncbi:hypothetical protein E3N88_14135 [Mikania micrantha]|uniref:Retrotransposon gag domain-containing protein n=1 Tax=Mikania micrantha TaxID=192012 RepID=A0A5N6P3P4_9ASTR|nr:hypothetical protein E3N88_14135 [Mikania micrantha]
MANHNDDARRNPGKRPVSDELIEESRRRVDDIVAPVDAEMDWRARRMMHDRVPPPRCPGDTSSGRRLPPLGVPLEQAFAAHVVYTRREARRNGELSDAWAEQFIVEPPPEDGPQFEVEDLEEGDFDEDPEEDEDDDGADSDISHKPSMVGRGPYARHTRRTMDAAVIKMMVDRRVNKAIAEYEASRQHCETSGTNNGPTLTWWNTHVQTLGLDGANSMSWTDFTRLLQEEYCPRDEIRKLEVEFWVLKMVGSEIEQYCTRFHELCKLCPAIVTPEYKKIE